MTSFFCRVYADFFVLFSPTFLGSFCRLFVDFLVTIFVEFYATFVDLKEFQFLSVSFQKQTKMAVFVILTVLALNTWTSEGVRLLNYIPTLQVYPGGRYDIIESYFRLGLD